MTSFVQVADQDRGALVDFMFAHAPTMMFPLTNLNTYGLGAHHPRAISAWVMKDRNRITDVLTWSQGGMVFPCCPNAPWEAAAKLLQGQEVLGFLGEGAQVTTLRRALGFTQTAKLDAIEPSFLLTLADLKRPDDAGLTLHPLGAAPQDLIIAWRAAYEVETMNIAENHALDSATRQVRKAIATDSHRVLMRNGQPVAMTGFNAVLPEIVQIGGVFTPPEYRGRGYAKAAVAQHLLEAAVDGVTEAVLSAANDAAARVYSALGFERTGEFALVIYDKPQAIRI